MWKQQRIKNITRRDHNNNGELASTKKGKELARRWPSPLDLDTETRRPTWETKRRTCADNKTSEEWQNWGQTHEMRSFPPRSLHFTLNYAPTGPIQKSVFVPILPHCEFPFFKHPLHNNHFQGQPVVNWMKETALLLKNTPPICSWKHFELIRKKGRLYKND